MSEDNAAPPPFELGLVMAGAVSGGAYTAGVLDFLLEALEAWRAEVDERQNPDVPDHRVTLRAAAGTSAGGIHAALLALYPWLPLTPMGDLNGLARPQDAPGWQQNLLYRSWVAQVDLRPMLGTGDLPRGKPVTSLLSDAPLRGIAGSVLDDVFGGTAPKRRAYMSDPFDVYLCLTNLSGVDYTIPMHGEEGPIKGHRMTTHADQAFFRVHGLGMQPVRPAVLAHGLPFELQPPDAGNRAEWSRLAEAALASGAFPVALPPVRFAKRREQYAQRPWVVPREHPEDGQCTEVRTIEPDWTDTDGFWCVDGGVINNEPLEFGRRALAGVEHHNARVARNASRAVLMIDPFPEESPREVPADAPDAVHSLLTLFGAMKRNGRFKPDELVLAAAEDVYSRFIVAPTRFEADGTRVSPASRAIASGGLGGFSGFLHERYRMHDFQLGRRNCQRFLDQWLVIDRENPLVRDWVQRMETAGKQTVLDAELREDEHGERRMLRLIPLCGTAAQTVPAPAWPAIGNAAKAGLGDAIKARTRLVVRRVLFDKLQPERPRELPWYKKPFAKVADTALDQAAKLAGRVVAGRVEGFAMKQIDAFLRDWKL